MAKPGYLALGVAACGLLRVGDGLGQSGLPAHHGQSLPVSQRFKRFDTGGNASREQSLHFFHQTVREHPRRSVIQPGVQRSSGREEPDFSDAKASERVRRRLAVPRTAGQQADFEGAHGFRNIPTVDLVCRSWVQAAQHAMERTRSAVLTSGQAGSQLLVSRGEFRQAIQESAEVKARSAGDHGRFTPRHYPVYGFTGEVDVIPCCEHLIRGRHANQMVWDITACRGWNFGGSNVEIPVDLQ